MGPIAATKQRHVAGGSVIMVARDVRRADMIVCGRASHDRRERKMTGFVNSLAPWQTFALRS
jgi:hypothetical protein